MSDHNLNLESARRQAVGVFVHWIARAIQSGHCTGGSPCQVERVRAVVGPRSGAIELLLGLDAGRVARSLAADDCAMLRRYVAWDFRGEPQVYMCGRYLRLEAGWPDNLAEKVIRLSDVARRPLRLAGGWIAGKSERGEWVVPHLSDKTPHFLLAGSTGAGKSVALRSAILQLSRDESNEIVLVDGKWGESLKPLDRLPGVVAPCATELPDAKAALAWVVGQMRERYRDLNAYSGRLVVIIDEIQTLVDDAAIVDLVGRIAGQGRAARVHLLISTHHPTVEAFGDPAIRRNLTGKIAFHVADPDASRVAVGGNTPRADHLLGAGDAYVVTPDNLYRVQSLLVDLADVNTAMEKGNGRCGRWQFETWPEFDAASIGQSLPSDGEALRDGSGRVQFRINGKELAAAIIAAAEGWGRPALQTIIERAGLGKPGSSRAQTILDLGREALAWLDERGYSFARPAMVENELAAADCLSARLGALSEG